MSELLRALRERAGLSVIEVAQLTGLHRQTIYGWESGAKEPDKQGLRAACDVYGATEEERDQLARLRAFGAEDTVAAVSA